MRNNLKELKKLARKVRLSADEKSVMRGELLRYMEAHPIRNGESLRALAVSNGTGHIKEYRAIPSPFSISRFRDKKALPILIILGLLVGGGTSFAAEYTVPGDIFYPVKVHINEGVRGVVALSAKAKAEWGVRLVERRLKEIEKIESNPNVSLQVKEAAQANLDRYTERVNKHILKLEENDDSKNAIALTEKFTKVLRAHEEIINFKVQSEQGDDASTLELLEAISPHVEKQSNIKDVREKAEEKQKELEQKYRTEIKVRSKPLDTVPVIDTNRESIKKWERAKTES